MRNFITWLMFTTITIIYGYFTYFGVTNENGIYYYTCLVFIVSIVLSYGLIIKNENKGLNLKEIIKKYEINNRYRK